jgi:hypothetical protein
MAVNETVSGNDSVAITGTATPGERTIGVRGHSESIGVEGIGTRWHGVVGMSSSTIGGFGVYGANTARGDRRGRRESDLDGRLRQEREHHRRRRGHG